MGLSREVIETTDENGWIHRRCEVEVPENSRVIGGVLCRWWGLEEPEGVKYLNDIAALQQQLTEKAADRDFWQKQAEIQAESLRTAQVEVERLNIGKGSSITGQEADTLRQQLVEYQKMVINYEVDARLMFVLADEYKKQLAEAEFWIREHVWASHGCEGIYGDDGELQCNNLTRHGKPLDFKRMPMEEVFAVDTQCKLEMLRERDRS